MILSQRIAGTHWREIAQNVQLSERGTIKAFKRAMAREAPPVTGEQLEQWRSFLIAASQARKARLEPAAQHGDAKAIAQQLAEDTFVGRLTGSLEQQPLVQQTLNVSVADPDDARDRLLAGIQRIARANELRQLKEGQGIRVEQVPDRLPAAEEPGAAAT